MAAARRTWRSTRRDYARAFPHQVALPNAGGWRTDHTGAALQHLTPDDFRWWTEAGQSVWGFAALANAVAFEAWASASGIDWSVPPEEQADRPPTLHLREREPLQGWEHLWPPPRR